ncbi:S9 family peptidase, partial [Xanthomonas hortorum pv. gardneri]|uniref:S9 family peptidase n=1 Tax=Xanthomonas hortorum TaxID=56454 RepID=UPI003F7F6347
MSKLASICLVAGLITAGAVSAEETAVSNDPYAWLEDVTGAKPLEWVKAQNAKTEARLAATPAFTQMETSIREVLDSDAKIPGVQKIGPYYYNFWKDKQHERGLWRRTTLDEYRKPAPKWETVLDLDALNKAEGENWVWHGADCLRPEYQRCLIALSRGGADADVTREFDLAGKQWVKDGFFRPEAKVGLGWVDKDTVYVYTDFGPGALTSSGYPRIAKQWKRGTPLSAATVVYEGKPTDMYIAAMHDDTPGFERDFVSRTLAFYNEELYFKGADGKLVKVDAPNSASKAVKREWLTLELRDPWTVGGKTYKAGSLLATRFDDFMAGKRNFDVLFEPTDTTSLAGIAWTKSHLVLNVLEDVKNRLSVVTPSQDGWKKSAFVGAPAFGTVDVSAVDSDDSDALWLTVTDYLTPTTLSWVEVGSAPQPLKTMPAFFDAGKDSIEQHFATSKDGARVPYFLVRPKDLKLDGSAPTLLYGYGGFEISMTPNYSGSMGRAWLGKGGVYVVANIRGGGEYGPRWAPGARKHERQKC